MHRCHKGTGGDCLVLLSLAATLAWGGCKTGLTEDNKKKARKAIASVAKVERQIADTEKKLQAVIDEDKAFMSKTRTVTEARAKLAKARASIPAAQKSAHKLKKILDVNQYADVTKLERLIREIEKKVDNADQTLRYVVAPARDLLIAKKNAKKLIQEVADTRKLVTTYPPTPVTETVAQAAKKYPKVKGALQARLKALGGQKITALADAFDAAQRKEPPDYLSMGRLVNRLRAKKLELAQDRKRFLLHIAELDDHVDLILVDMKDERGSFYHKYKSVHGKTWKTTPWQRVSSSYHKKHSDHLGMAVYAKPKGTFHTRAIRVASPPGYAYVGLEEYGKWNKAGKTKTWKFHPQYSYMIPLFFGATAATVTFATHQTYQKRLRRGLVFYGLGGAILYGTRSARMKTKYKHFYKRRARKIRIRQARRSGSRRSGRSSRGSRRRGK